MDDEHKQSGTAKKTVLVIDDAELNRQILRLSLETACRVIEARNGAEGLALLAQQPVDLLITDIVMSPVDGYELIARVRQDGRYDRLPIIAITEQDGVMEQRLLRLGADDFIYKPFLSKAMEHCVSGLLFGDRMKNRVALYHRVFDDSPIPFLLYRLTGGAEDGACQRVYGNDAVRRMLRAADLDHAEAALWPVPGEQLAALEAVNRSGEARQMQTAAPGGIYLELTLHREATGYVALVLADVTAQISQERLVQAERDKFSHLLDAVPGGIAVFSTERGKDSQIQYFNDEICALTGYSRQEILARGASQLCRAVEEDLPAVTEWSRLAVWETAPSTTQFRIRRKDGTERYVQVRMSSERVREDLLTSYVVYTDVTEQKQTQLVLEESNALYRLMSEYTDVNFWQYDIVNDVLQNSENSLRTHLGEMVIPNFTRAAVEGDLIRKDSRAAFLALHERLRKGERTASAEVWIRGREQTWWCERITYITAFDGEGHPVRAVGIGKNITEEATERLRRQKYRILLDNTDLLIWEYQADNHCIFPENETAGSRLQNGRQRELTPQNMVERGVIHPASAEAFLAMYRAIDRGESSASAEICMVDTLGRQAWQRIHLRAIPAGPNLPIRALGWGVEITKYKEAEQKFGEEAAYLTGAQGSTLLGMCRANISHDRMDSYTGTGELLTTAGNPCYTDAMEYIAGLCTTEEMAADFRAHMLPEGLTAAYRSGQREATVEYARRMKEGRILWVRTTAKLNADPVTDELICFIYTRNIDREKMMQLILDRVAATEFGLLGLLYLSQDRLHCVRYSEMETQLASGVDTAYSVGIADYVAHYLPENLREEAGCRLSLEEIRKNLEARDTYTCSYPVEFQGKVLHKKWEFSYLDDSREIVVFTRADVTELFEEQARQREALRSALVQAQAASLAKTDFLSHMSHEIRTPMNAIIGMSALAAQCANDPVQVSECISKVGISARFLLSLINDILDMSRIESGKVVLKQERFPFEELIGSVNTIIYNQAREKGVDYDCVLDSFTDSYYVGDATKLQQVLVNLLGNAVKFTPAGGKTQLILHQTKLDDQRAMLTFTVNDTGIGIREEDQERIFQPFEQANTGATSFYQGTGLGLAICKNLVTMMGGTITVNSIEGVGSEFTVRLPLGVCEEGTAKLAPAIPFEKLQTLIVDDDVMICEHTQNTLREMGVRAEWVPSGRQAVTLVRQRQARGRYFDVVLLDWKMPEMDGIETARQLRTIVGPEVTIIVITAYDWSSIEQEAKAAGVNLLITKPLFKSTLMSAFQRVYTERAEQKEPDEPREYDFSGSRVLLVEDHILNVEVAKRLLESKHITVEVAENGLRAIELFTTAAPEYYKAILMDIRMPVMDGLTAARSIRQLRKADAKTVPIIAMSANAFDEDIEKSKAAGMNAHLSKPIDPQLLFATLERYLGSET